MVMQAVSRNVDFEEKCKIIYNYILVKSVPGEVPIPDHKKKCCSYASQSEIRNPRDGLSGKRDEDKEEQGRCT